MKALDLFFFLMMLAFLPSNTNAQTKKDGNEPAVIPTYNANGKLISYVEALQEGGASANIEAVKLHLAKGSDPNIKFHGSPILCLALEGNLELAKVLLNTKGIRVNDRSVICQSDGWIETSTAILRGANNPEILKILIEKGANVNAEGEYYDPHGCDGNEDKNTAIMLTENIECVKLLIAHGAKVNIRNAKGATPLIKAIHSLYINDKPTKNEDMTVFKFLLDNGADPNFTEGQEYNKMKGQSALMAAADSGYFNMCTMLLDKGANIEYSDFHVGQTALHRAARSGKLAIVKLLLDRGAKVDAPDKYKSTALNYAANLDIINLLLDKGANPNSHIVRGVGGSTEDGIKKYTLLLNRGMQINHQDDSGFTLFFGEFMFVTGKQNSEENKSQKRSMKVAEFLLSKGANINLPDLAGITPLMIASGNTEEMKFLLKNGANINLQDTSGKTVLMRTAAAEAYPDENEVYNKLNNQKKDSASSVLEGAIVGIFTWGIDKHIKNNVSNAFKMNTKCVEFLLDNGADIEAKDKDGNTALYWAQRYKRTGTIKLLIARGAKPAKEYKKADDKRNITSGIIGTWKNVLTFGPCSRTEIVTFNADYTCTQTFIEIDGKKVVREMTYEIIGSAIQTNTEVNWGGMKVNGNVLSFNGTPYTKVVNTTKATSSEIKTNGTKQNAIKSKK